MKTKRLKIEEGLRTELTKNGAEYHKIQIVDYYDNYHTLAPAKMVIIVVNISDDWDCRELAEVKFLDGQLHEVNGKVSGKVLRILQGLLVEEKPKETGLKHLGLAVRAYNGLTYCGGIKTIEQLEKLSHKDLSRIRNLGKKSVEHIEKKLTEYWEAKL